jgi:glycosyltransferase involved in cell wall biosynthesis
MRHTVVMVTSSYPRFPGDTIGTFMEPIARGVAARGHDVHLVAPWHPRIRRAPVEAGVTFHFFRYAPIPSLNVFGYSGALRADTDLRWSALAAAPLALLTGWQTARRVAAASRATVMHGHWMIPGGAIATAAAGSRPVVVSLHGSDVYVAERHRLARRAARATLNRAAWVTACSDDLRSRALALGGRAAIEVIPYGVDADRFKPDASGRAARRAALQIGDEDPLLFTAGRFVRKKGFEFLIDAVADLQVNWPQLKLAVAGSGDLSDELRARARDRGVADRVRFVGEVSQDEVAGYLAAADIAVVPSIRDDAGNVDGLPNVVMEALASGTPLVTTEAGGIGAVVAEGRTAAVVPERDKSALARVIDDLLRNPERRMALGRAAREDAIRRHGWDRVAARFEDIYDAVVRDRTADSREVADAGRPC